MVLDDGPQFPLCDCGHAYAEHGCGSQAQCWAIDAESGLASCYCPAYSTLQADTLAAAHREFSTALDAKIARAVIETSNDA